METQVCSKSKKISIISKKKSKALQCYLMLSTQLIGFLVFTLYPMCWAANKAWYYYTGARLETRFVGWENFLTLFTKDFAYWQTWSTTFKFAIFKMPIELIIAMILALILNRKIKGKGFFRSMYFLPNIISVAIVGLIFTNMFNYFGIINAWLVKLNITSAEVDWFSNTSTAMAALVIGAIWQTFGINVLYFLAALSNVPEELYESAYLDGASEITIFFKITLPLMAPVLQTILLLSIIGTLQVNDYILVTTNGAPGGTTYTVMSYVVSKFVPGFADANVNIGYGCAMSLVTSIIMCIIALGYSKLSKKMQNLY